MRTDLVSAVPWKRLIAEFAVIVASVLIALAVDSAWDRRQERNRAREYLKQLLLDFSKTDSRLKGAMNVWLLLVPAIRRGLRAAAAGAGGKSM